MYAKYILYINVHLKPLVFAFLINQAHIYKVKNQQAFTRMLKLK